MGAQGMLQVVFSESERGSLKQALHCRPKSGPDGPMGVVFGAPQEEQAQALARLKARLAQEHRRARPVGGESGDVLCPCLGLDVGPLTGADAEQARFQLLTAWLGGDFPLPEQDPQANTQAQRQWQACQQDRKRLLDEARQGQPVRIWYSQAPYSLCGFYETLWQLRESTCPVTAVELPQWRLLEDGVVQRCHSWGELPPGDWAAYLPLEQEIPQSVRRAIALDWARLRQENAPLRAVLSGRLVSVSADFYDPLIRAQIPDGPFRVANLIGDVLGRYQLGIGDWWIAKRIQDMEAKGELCAVAEANEFYRRQLRRADGPCNTPCA